MKALIRGVTRDFPSVVIGLFIVLIHALLAVFAPWIAPHDPIAVQADKVLAAPDAQFLLGTDGNGMDILSRLI